MSKTSMQFLFGDRELFLVAQDLLTVNTDVIVCSSNSELTFPGGLAGKILQGAGEQIKMECERTIHEYGKIDSGMAVYTSAGKLSYKAVVHAVGPKMGEGDEQFKLEQAISRSLQLCEMNEWRSIAFPAIATGKFGVPLDICAQALFRSITHFWDARHECVLDKIVICTTARNFQAFFEAFREEGTEVSEQVQDQTKVNEEKVGEITLNEEDINALKEGDIDGWFK